MPARRQAQESLPAGQRPPEARDWLPFLFIIAAAFLAYANVYPNEFLLDDEMDIIQNARLRDWHTLVDAFTSSFTAGAGNRDIFYRPLQTLLYLFIYKAFGLNTVPFHILNITLHALNGCLVYALGRRLGFKPLAVVPATLLWLMHPLFVESVAYMSGTADLLYAAFSLFGLLVLFPDFSLRKYMLAAPVYLLAMLGKETGILFPLLSFACQYYAGKHRFEFKNYLKAWPLLLAAGIYFVMRHNALGDNYDFYKQSNIYTENILYRLYTFLATLPEYIRLFVWPDPLYMDRNFPVYTQPLQGPVLAGAAILLVSSACIILARRRGALPLNWGLMWFAGAHVLHTGVFLPLNSLFLEHWMYVPAIGFFLGATQSLALLLEKASRKITAATIALAFVAAAALGARTWDQNKYWRDPIVFYTHIIESGTVSARAHNNLANAYAEGHQTEKAIEHLRIAISLSDKFPQTHHNLALELLRMPDSEKNIDEAIAELNRAVQLNPEFFQSYELLANIYAYRGDRAKETENRTRALALRKHFRVPAEHYAQPRLTSSSGLIP
ncbi:MAG: hypothetical protein AB7H77_09370 [Bdellovibrionales bacterium]